MSQPTVFVCGATGTQGGAAARHLLSSGATVHAVARDPSSPNATAISAAGARLWPGHFEDETALRAAMAGASAVFLNFMPVFTDPGANLREARTILRVAREVGVQHVVYTSTVGLAEGQTKSSSAEGGTAGELDWFFGSLVAAFYDSKRDIEREVQQGGFQTWTILRPAWFMSNWVDPFAKYYEGLSDRGRWVTAFREDTVIPIVDTETIGVFSAAALLNPDSYNRKIIAYADEKVPVGECFEKLSKAAGKDIRVAPVPDAEIPEKRVSNPFIGGQHAMATIATPIDMDEVKALGLTLSNFDKFLDRERDVVVATFRDIAN